MLQQLVHALGVALLCAAVSQAAIIGIVTKQVNPGNQTCNYAGFARNQTTNPAPTGPFAADTGLNTGSLADTWVSYILGVTATAGEKISALDVSLTAPLSPTSGFHQAWTANEEDPAMPIPTPSGTSIINGDSHLFPGAVIVGPPAENKFNSGGPPSATDTATKDYGVGSSLTGLWGYSGAEQAAQPAVRNFAYIVIPRGSEPSVNISVKIALNDPAGQPMLGIELTNSAFGVYGSPPPQPIVVLNALGERNVSAGIITACLMTDNCFDAPVTWSNLTQTMGPPAAIAATLSGENNATFNWDPTGSQAGATGSGMVKYQWTATVTSAFGADTGVAIEIILVPEPATVSLLGLAAVGLVGIVRRRR